MVLLSSSKRNAEEQKAEDQQRQAERRAERLEAFERKVRGERLEAFNHNSRILDLIAADVLSVEEASRLWLNPGVSSLPSDDKPTWHRVYPPLPEEKRQQ